jgi:hypothetical protein
MGAAEPPLRATGGGSATPKVQNLSLFFFLSAMG